VDPDEIVEQGTILRATVGSTVHGLHHGGQDDRDEMAVFVEPPSTCSASPAPPASVAVSTVSSTLSSGRSRKEFARARAIST
jgi:hypothetical protein